MNNTVGKSDLAFEEQLELLDPDEERQLVELGMEDYRALVDDGEGASED
jgi:hypothetical protein